jgi:hypothetical protein
MSAQESEKKSCFSAAAVEHCKHNPTNDENENDLYLDGIFSHLQRGETAEETIAGCRWGLL